MTHPSGILFAPLVPQIHFSLETRFSKPSKELLALDLSACPKIIAKIATRLTQADAVAFENRIELYRQLIQNGSLPRAVKKIPSHSGMSAFEVQCEKDGHITKRILILARQTAPTQNICGYVLGNVDLFIIPLNPTFDEEISLQFDHNLSNLSNEHLLKIARYLDHGQKLNLSSLTERSLFPLSPQTRLPHDIYGQYFSDVDYYAKTAPNGILLHKPMGENFYLLHQTAYKTAILAAGTLKVSRNGCMGNVAYTTEIMQNQGGELFLGGHAMGLHHRKHGNSQPDPSQFIPFQATRPKNMVTNWSDKLGRGLLFLEARKDFLSSNDLYHTRSGFEDPQNSINLAKHGTTQQYLEIDQKIGAGSIAQYRAIYPLLSFFLLYTRPFDTKSFTERPHHQPERLQKDFATVKRILSNIESKTKSILNGIFFEVIKDYILLFQVSPTSEKWKSVGSFDMHSQYELFFLLHPDLKNHWDINQFPISFDQLFKTFKDHKLIDKSLNPFYAFFLDRFNHAINMGCLNGITSLPHPDLIQSFEELSLSLPNLSGLIYNNTMKAGYAAHEFSENFAIYLRAHHTRSYSDRNLEILIKCGMGRTEEIGVCQNVALKALDPVEVHKSSSIYKIQGNQLKPIQVAGLTETNGYTTRSLEAIAKYFAAQKPHQWSLNTLNEESLPSIVQAIIKQNYLKSFLKNVDPIALNENPITHQYLKTILLFKNKFSANPALLNRRLLELTLHLFSKKATTPLPIDQTSEPKYFEVTSQKMPRVTHGGMHAARVTAYVATLHRFRLAHGDRPNLEALSPFLNESQLIHLLQIAGCFHDSARQGEGRDRWDKESSERCLNFLQTHFSTLPEKVLLLIAYTIEFKDQQSTFIKKTIALGFSQDEAQNLDYLRQLIHDADCLDILRVRSQFKMEYLDLTRIEKIPPQAIFDLVTQTRELIRLQGDQYKANQIVGHTPTLPSETPLAPKFDLDLKSEYEWDQNLYHRILKDMEAFPHLGSNKPLNSAL